MLQKSLIYLFLLFTCAFSNGFSSESIYSENLGSSIHKIMENKVYLNPGYVQIAKNGIFIDVEGELLPIDHLEVDQDGVYFEPHRMKVESCETCGIPLVWGKCVNPACPSKKKKKS